MGRTQPFTKCVFIFVLSSWKRRKVVRTALALFLILVMWLDIPCVFKLRPSKFPSLEYLICCPSIITGSYFLMASGRRVNLLVCFYFPFVLIYVDAVNLFFNCLC